MNRQNKSVDEKSQAFEYLPQVGSTKGRAQSYVTDRIIKIRNGRIQKKSKSFLGDETEKTLEPSVQKESKKNIIFSSNKIITTNKVLSTFEPFQRELQLLRKKSQTISYHQFLSNLRPLSNGLSDLVKSQKQYGIKYSDENPINIKNYKSSPKKRNSRSYKYTNQTIVHNEGTLCLNAEKMSLIDSQQRNIKRLIDKAGSHLGNFTFFNQSCEQKQMNEQNNSLHMRFQYFKIKSKMQKTEQTVEQQKLPKIKDQQSDANSQQQIEKIDKVTEQSVEPSKKRVKKMNGAPYQTYYYRLFIWKVRYSNSMSIQTPLQYQHRLRAYIGKGNNSGLVRGLLKRRIWFAITQKIQQANFVWTQIKSLPYFKLQNINNNVPRKESKQQVEKEYSESYLTKGDLTQMNKYMKTYVQSEQKTDERLIFRTKYFNSKVSKTIKANDISSFKIQNHLINNYVIGNKKALFQTMSAYYAQKGEQVFDYLPLTFHIKNGLEDPIYFKFLKYYYNRAKQIKASNSKLKNIWIVKPGQNSNRGNGIKVCLTLEQIKAILKKKEAYPDGTYRTYIVQSYIEKPLLYHKRKFDLRHYMMITCVNGFMKGYWYRQGYVRTTSSQYSLGTNCSEIHLTNDAVQKKLPDYGKYQKGNKLSYDELQVYMAKISKKKSAVSFKQDILPKMKKIATDAMRACSGSIDPERKQNNFQIFGLDFMIDSEMKLYLIEINSNPCLELSCPILGSIIPKMVQNTLEMTLDAQFPPPVRYSPKGVHYFKNLQAENKYELVYDSRVQKIYNCSMDVLDQKLLEEQDDVFEDDGEEIDIDQ